jgi:hypothetical protein
VQPTSAWVARNSMPVESVTRSVESLSMNQPTQSNDFPSLGANSSATAKKGRIRFG